MQISRRPSRKPFSGIHKPTFIKNRLKNDRGNLSRKFLEAVFHAWQIIETGDGHVGDGGFGNAAATRNGIRRVGIAPVFFFGFDTDQRRVMQAVVGAFKLQNLVAPGRCGKRAW